MIYQISLLTTFLVAVIYPLCFWFSYDNPLKQGFHKFHTGLPCFLGGIVVVFILMHHYPAAIKSVCAFWLTVLLLVSLFYWKKETPSALVMSGVSLLGAVAYIGVSNFLIGYSLPKLIASFLGGFIFCLSLFAMNLGHWYLNVHGLPVKYLRRSTVGLGFFLALRLIWDILQLFRERILIQGDSTLLYQFSLSMDGFLLYLGILFGVVFPLTSIYFALGTLKLKNTQATTGILYVILCAVLLGDMTYKYYLIKFGVAL